MAELKQIPIDQLQPHPDNPRLVLREDIVESIAAQLKAAKKFGDEHALLVRPVNGHFQIISGHTRTEAARRAKIKSVPCWVKEMSDAEALMELVKSNAQADLGTIERALHIYKCVDPQKNGGIAGYAKDVGIGQSTASELYSVGGVLSKSNKYIAQAILFLEKAKHIRYISALPTDSQGAWDSYLDHILKVTKDDKGKEKSISSADVEKNVKAANEAVKNIHAEVEAIYAPYYVALQVVTARLTRGAVRDCIARYLVYLGRREQLDNELKLRQPETHMDIEPAEDGGEPYDTMTVKRPYDYEAADDAAITVEPPDWIWNVAEIERREQEVNKELNALRELKATAHQSDALSFLHSVEDESVDLLITDPPYMTDVEDIDFFVAEWLPIAIRKLKPTGRAYICTGAYPEELAAYGSVLTLTEGLTVGVPLVWGYNNTVGPAPTHDYKTNIQMIWHVYKADAPPLNTAVLTEKNTLHVINAPDGRTGTRWHAWEKPMELASMLVRHALSQAGAFVIDPFAGTGTFLLAATEQGHIAVGADNDPEMIAIQERRGVKHE